MAPKRGLLGAAAAARKAAGKTGPAPTTKPKTGSAASQEKKSEPEEGKRRQRGVLRTWAHVPPKRCYQCEQTTHEFDRDAVGEKQLLAWSKFAKNAAGLEYPVGEECYRCYDTRRRHFSYLDLRDLKSNREQYRCVDDKFTELRAGRVRGETMYQFAENVEIEKLVKRSHRDFAERYVEGTFTSLRAFCAQRGLEYPDSDDEDGYENLVHHIKSKLRLTVTKDKDGTVGVEVLDHQPGQYRFRRGQGDQVSTTKNERFDHDAKVGNDLAKDRHRELAQKQGAVVGVFAAPAITEPPPESSDSEHDESPPPTVEKPRRRRSPSPTADLWTGAKSSSAASAASGCKSGAMRRRSRSPSLAAGSEVSGYSRRSVEALGSAIVPRAPGPAPSKDKTRKFRAGQSDADGPAKKQRRKHSDVAIDGAREAVDKTLETHSWAGLGKL